MVASVKEPKCTREEVNVLNRKEVSFIAQNITQKVHTVSQV